VRRDKKIGWLSGPRANPRQRNPFNAERAEARAVIPDPDVEEICRFAEEHRDRIDFGRKRLEFANEKR